MSRGGRGISANGEAAAAPRFDLLAVNLVCVLLLMWPALINRQPVFFPDTTSYVRAADYAVRLATHGRIETAWSRPAAPAPPPPGAPPAAMVRGNDVASGNIMAGRSPYFGALLYVGYVLSDFWLFVLAQAMLGCFLIHLALRAFAIDRPRSRLAIAAFLAAGSTLAVYVSMLLADALAGFGILAFLLLLAPGRLRRWEWAVLFGVILLSAVSHLTHIVMLLAMTAALGLVAIGWKATQPRLIPVVWTGAIGVAIGLASVMVTSATIRATFGKPPVLVPLMTARFIADGPGRDFIAAGCGGHRFAVCTLPYHGYRTGTDFLWSRDPATGAYLLADSDLRRRISTEDTAFALAVWRAYPVRQTMMMAQNTIVQLLDLESPLNSSCFSRDDCDAGALPEATRARMRASLSGRDLWPVRAIAFLDSAVVVGSIGTLAFFLPKLRRADPAVANLLLVWTGITLLAMLANAFFGGAISEPQGRYQARIVWLLPFFAAILVTRYRAATRPSAGAAGYAA